MDDRLGATLENAARLHRAGELTAIYIPDERDEAIRREPRAPYAWDGVAEVRPFGAMEKNIVEGVY